MAFKVLPGTGRGTAAAGAGVEGHVPRRKTFEVPITRPCPSTTLRVVPLPLRGRI